MALPSMPSADLDRAFAAQTANYITAAIQTAWVWDLLTGIFDEIRVFSGKRLTFPNVAYVVARITTFSFLTVALSFSVGPVNEHCHNLIKASAWFGAIAAPCNTLLFFIRIRGIFHDSPKIIAIFALLWFSTCASLTAPLSFSGVNVDLINRVCLMTDVKPFGVTGFLTIFVFDTAVFIAITIRALSISLANTWRGRLRLFFLSGDSLGYITKVLLHSGQLYYLATVGLNCFVIIVLIIPTVSSTYRATLTVPMVALQNAMACRVFRLLKLGSIQDVSASLLSTTNVSRNRCSTVQFAPTGDPMTSVGEWKFTLRSHLTSQENGGS